MDRKIISMISLGFLFLAFGVVSLLVVLSNRSPYLVAKKLRLGALILSISSASIGCFTTTCYVQAPPNQFKIDQVNYSTDTIVVSKTIQDTIMCKVFEREGDVFSYAIFDSLDSIIFKENLQPVDGSFDEDYEEFKICIDQSILPGTYSLQFYTIPKESIQSDDWSERSYKLKITE